MDTDIAAAQHSYRVIVRGTFAGLGNEARAALLAEVDAHGLAGMRFTPEGSLTYDRTLKHFSYRYEIHSEAADGEEMAGAIAEDLAERALASQGWGFDRLRSTVTDMDTMKINRKPGRR
ncbi:DUF6204 family protein [Streptomyces tsukubensis]|uniref:Uncharacterized protein n=1 Tax=Streptomyces tsukubensis TaxID=83656 RepID=A0A1V4ADB4_9ACTN|nr:DUF6204 family protein [Streptomyces tsukubensis]OON81750.1 hypothetical protein B1H18_06360 [Streptomyces tsukubensis]QFR96527.1 hypothetical protein GBW32_30220 [Streptomyces tsukubensis]